MTAQRHQIQRQTIEFSVEDQPTGQRLHEELSRIQREIIEPLLDKCCSELSAPDRVHRIARLEVDLGDLAIEDLERVLLEKLEPALREGLAAKILEEEQLSEMLGEDPAAMAQAELISLFARTGTLPFWADSSEPRVVDAAVERLLARDGPMLKMVVRELARDARALKRLVRHIEPERLRALVEVLVEAPRPVGAERVGELWELLAIAASSSVMVPRATLWAAAIETVFNGEGLGEPTTFFRDILGRAALEIGVAYRSVVQALFAASGARARGMGSVLQKLAEEVGAGEREGKPGTFGGRRDGTKAPGAHGDGTTSAKVPAESKVPDEKVLDEKVPNEKVPTTFGGADAPGQKARTIRTSPPAPLQRRFAPLERGVSLRNEDHFPLSAESSEGERGLGGEVPKVPTTFASPRQPATTPSDASDPSRSAVPTPADASDASRSAASTRSDVFDASRPPATTRSKVTDVPRASAAASSEFSDGPRAASATSSNFSDSPRRAAATSSEFSDVPRASSAPQPSLPHKRDRHAHLHEDPDQIYLDTSGLVLVWPFLATYFERLELLADKKSFRDEAARARAVVLLQYLATTDPEPPDYRLPLAKVLCGLPFDELATLTSELTEAEQTESASVLSAVLQHAKIFGEVSVDDFRAAFLVRRGILSTRDGAWLLRVERAPYDLVLQQLPWPLTWVRLPWMQAPMYVEWIR